LLAFTEHVVCRWITFRLSLSCTILGTISIQVIVDGRHIFFPSSLIKKNSSEERLSCFLANASLVGCGDAALFWEWDEATFLANTEGSPIRRTGYQSFKRNIAIGLGNAPYSNEIVAKLQEAKPWHDEIVNVHIDWAIQQQLQQINVPK
jgi:hypothetical protein